MSHLCVGVSQVSRSEMKPSDMSASHLLVCITGMCQNSSGACHVCRCVLHLPEVRSQVSFMYLLV